MACGDVKILGRMKDGEGHPQGMFLGFHDSLSQLKSAYPVSGRTPGEWAYVKGNKYTGYAAFHWNIGANSWRIVAGVVENRFINSPSTGHLYLQADPMLAALVPNATNTNDGAMSHDDKAQLGGNTAAISGNADNIATLVASLASTDAAVMANANEINKRVTYTSSTKVIYVAPGENIQAALDELCRYVFTDGAYGHVLLQDGEHVIDAPLSFRHPQQYRIYLTGAGVGPTPAASDLTGVAADDLAFLKTQYRTHIKCNDRLTTLQAGQSVILQNALIYNARPAADNIAAIYGYDTGFAQLNRAAFFGFYAATYMQNGSKVAADRVVMAHGKYGAITYYGSAIGMNYSVAAYNSSYGVYLFNFTLMRGYKNEYVGNSYGVVASLNSSAYDDSSRYPNNTIRGFMADIDSSLYSTACHYTENGYEGIYLSNGSSAYITGPTFSNNYGASNRDLYVLSGGEVSVRDIISNTGGACVLYYNTHGNEYGTHVGSPVFSPAVGNVGNENSKWR